MECGFFKPNKVFCSATRTWKRDRKSNFFALPTEKYLFSMDSNQLRYNSILHCTIFFPASQIDTFAWHVGFDVSRNNNLCTSSQQKIFKSDLCVACCIESFLLHCTRLLPFTHPCLLRRDSGFAYDRQPTTLSFQYKGTEQGSEESWKGWGHFPKYYCCLHCWTNFCLSKFLFSQLPRKTLRVSPSALFAW